MVDLNDVKDFITHGGYDACNDVVNALIEYLDEMQSNDEDNADVLESVVSELNSVSEELAALNSVEDEDE